MKELAGRLEALDADAGAALRAIAYFDKLVEGSAGLGALVRGVAVLAGCPARLSDPERGVRFGIRVDGTKIAEPGEHDPSWPGVPLAEGGPDALWLERPGPATVVDLVILERAATAIRTVLDRTRGRAPSADPALVEVLLDQAAAESVRLRAAARLGLGPTATVAALPGGEARIGPIDPASRAGIGPEVPVLDLPHSHELARKALRFTAEGTGADPGPRVVHAETLGGLILLADAVGPHTPLLPDVRALEAAFARAPWVAATFQAVAFAPSLRAAATELTLHHSTLQSRLTQAERWLGWPVHDPHGRLRLQLALALHRLHRNP